MATSSDPRLRYRKSASPGAGQYDVTYDGAAVGTVSRFQLGAGQFGSRWVAQGSGGQRSGTFMTRDAAAAWLVGQARS